MERSESVHLSGMEQLAVLQGVCTARKIALVLFNGYALREVAVLAVFQAANTLAEAETARSGQIPYKVCLLSAGGGRVDNSSSTGFVWTEDLQARGHSGGFRALFIGGGAEACNAVLDERLTTWLRRECPRSDLVVPIGEGRLLLDAAGFGRAGSREGARDPDSAQYPVPHTTVSAAFATSTQRALAVVQEDFGIEIARQIADHVVRQPQQTRLAETTGDISVKMIASVSPAIERIANPQSGNPGSGTASGRIRESCRWIRENFSNDISVSVAAAVAAMSVRNYMRRFKNECGVTPREYVMRIRFEAFCSMLVETELPFDKIARHCGLGNGDRMGRLFRKRYGLSPTAYRELHGTRGPAKSRRNVSE